VRLEYRLPSRGLIGYRTEFLTDTRGTGLLNHIFDGWTSGKATSRTARTAPSWPIARAARPATPSTTSRPGARCFVNPGEFVYEGQIVGENSRDNDLDVNITKEKKLTNMRASSADESIRLTPPAS